MTDLSEVLSAGATARAAGEPLSANPYYAMDALPAVTGEDPGEWMAKAEGWEAGWRRGSDQRRE